MARKNQNPLERLFQEVADQLVDAVVTKTSKHFEAQGLRLPTAAHEAPDPYDVLEVDHDAPMEKIHNTYRAKARMFHPDNLKTGDPERFKHLKAAYDAIRQDRQEPGGAREAPPDTRRPAPP
ncbi:MAG: J domain-containing protein [Dehalococcoidia bacterium]|nr:J domain-containing protein [Dehalococcoidia bacterium]